MTRNERVVSLVERWAKKVGVRPAIARLVGRDVKVSTAEKLCTGRYVSIPRNGLANLLLEEMNKDGFTLTGARAS